MQSVGPLSLPPPLPSKEGSFQHKSFCSSECLQFGGSALSRRQEAEFSHWAGTPSLSHGSRLG